MRGFNTDSKLLFKMLYLRAKRPLITSEKIVHIAMIAQEE